MTLKSSSFVTLAEVKTQFGISGSSEDSKLEFMIDAACDAAQTFCGRVFKQAEYDEELYDGEDSNTIVLKNAPVSSALADTPVVTLDGDEIDIEAINYEKGIVELASVLPSGLSNVAVSYKGGFADAAIPFDLKQAIILMVARARNSANNAGIASESVGDYSVSYQDVQSQLSADVKQILINYKNF